MPYKVRPKSSNSVIFNEYAVVSHLIERILVCSSFYYWVNDETKVIIA